MASCSANAGLGFVGQDGVTTISCRPHVSSTPSAMERLRERRRQLLLKMRMEKEGGIDAAAGDSSQLLSMVEDGEKANAAGDSIQLLSKKRTVEDSVTAAGDSSQLVNKKSMEEEDETAAEAGDSSQLLNKKRMEKEEGIAVSDRSDDSMDGKSAGRAAIASILTFDAEELTPVLGDESSKMDDRPWAAQSRKLSYNLNSDEAFDAKTQESTASEIDTEKPGFNGKSVFIWY